MSGALILGVTILIFFIAYLTYGTWLAKKWGVDPSRNTPAHIQEDGVDYVPAKAPVLMGHHFSSIAGVGAINGPIQAAVFGWVPVLLWILIGGIFFGAVQDFSALFASVRHKGKSLGEVLEENIGHKAKVCFTILAWLVLILMMASLGDIVGDTFTGFTKDPATGAMVKNSANGSIATASMLFIPLAVCFGFLNRIGLNLAVSSVFGVILLGGCIAAGLAFPVYLSKTTWMLIIFVYIFAASVAPVWLLLQPRDYLNSFLLYFLMAAAVVGICAANPTVQLKPFTGWNVDGNTMFPFLFITVACGAVSGFHSLVGAGTTSRQLDSEKDAKPISYGSMLIECVLAAIALITVGCLTTDGTYTDIGTPTQVFATAIGNFFTAIGLGEDVGQLVNSIILLAISAFAFTSLDTATRLARFLFQELFPGKSSLSKFLSNRYVATVVTIVVTGLLTMAGYQKIWTLFGMCNQLLAVPAFLAAACWLKRIGQNNKMFYFPMFFMLAAALGSLCLTFYHNVIALAEKAEGSSLLIQGIQNVLIVPIFVLTVIMVADGFKVLFARKKLI